ncbi:proteasome adapter and scaffold protein ECM29-like [Diadema antillarum]|uniref:proteasome adapter and scaffold protein ECM29-like n=1 Tax=Diadema antillarum TaxID=105358 RepID=UPI003A87443D
MFFEITFICKADFAESSYVYVKSGELMSDEGRPPFSSPPWAGATSGRGWLGSRPVCKTRGDLKEIMPTGYIFKSATLRTSSSLNFKYLAEFSPQNCEVWAEVPPKKTGDDSSDDEEMDRSYQDQKLKLKESAFANLGIAWPNKLETQKKECVHLCRVLCEGVEGSTFKLQLAILKSLHLFFQRLYLINADDVSSDDTETLSAILEMLVPAVYKTLGIVKYAAIRKKSLEVLEFLIPKCAEPSRQTVLSYWEAHDLQEALSKVTSDPDPAVRERAVLLKNVIKEAFVNDQEEEDKDALSTEKGDEDLVEKEGTSFE